MTRPSAATWHQEHRASCEEMARVLRLAAVELQLASLSGVRPPLAGPIEAALAEYDRVRDHP